MQFPRWISRSDEVNLREVGPNLYVGAELSPTAVARVPGRIFTVVFDLYGDAGPPSWRAARERTYRLLPDVRRRPFLDGDVFPDGLLDEINDAVARARRAGPVLIHCQAGLSRSASAAYAILRVQDGLSHDAALARVKAHRDFPRRATLHSARTWVHAHRGAAHALRGRTFFSIPSSSGL